MTLRQAASSPLRLGLVMAFFVANAVFFALILPVFQGPDEPVHYATLQRWAAEPKADVLRSPAADLPRDPDRIQSFSLNAEVTAAALLVHFDEIKWQPVNTLSLGDESFWGTGEQSFTETPFDHSDASQKTSTSGTWSWYYWLGAQIEGLLIETDFFTRFFSIRLLSVLLGLGTVIIAWRYFASSGIDVQAISIATLIVASQPMLIATSGVVNIDIALILAFALFAFSSTTLLIRGFSRSLLAVTLLATILGVTAKGPGIVLVFLLFPLALLVCPPTLWSHLRPWRVRVFGICALGIAAWLFISSPYFEDITRAQQVSVFPGMTSSLAHYFQASFDPDTLLWSHTSYWGNFGWLDTPLPDAILDLILALEILACFGLLGYFRAQAIPDFLPPKRVTAWALLMVLSLQVAIRFFDWRVFDATGQILIGTPGRYFLPTLLPFTLLCLTGLGWLMPERKKFLSVLTWLATGSLILLLLSLWHVLVPRYYF